MLPTRLILLALMAGAMTALPAALAEENPQQDPQALPSPQQGDRDMSAAPLPAAPRPAGALSAQHMSRQRGADEAWGSELGYEIVQTDPTWNQGPWQSDESWDGGSAGLARHDQFWAWVPSDGAQEGWDSPDDDRGDPAAIPGPGRDRGRRPKSDQFRQRNWGILGDESGPVAPAPRYPRQFSFDRETGSDTNRYDQEAAFVDWWDSSDLWQKH